MKKLFLVIGVIFCSSNIFPQYGEGFPVKQITFFNYNVKNPKFFEGSFYSPKELLFESYIDSTINVGLLSYDLEKDIFSNPIKFTDNSGQNLNPLGIKFYGGEIVFYQTNIEGTWDIAFREFKDNQWGMPKILVDSTGDEINPGFIDNHNGFRDSIKIFFERDSSIFMLAKKDSLIRIDTIFVRNDSLRYSQPSGEVVSVYDNNKWKEKINCVCKQTNAQNKSKLVQATFLDMQKISEKVLIDSGEVNYPKFQITDYNSDLTFENKLSGFSNIYFMDINNNKIQRLKDNPDGDLFSFSSSSAQMLITKSYMNKTVNKLIFSPYTFILRRNDSTFVRINDFKSYFYPPADSMIYTKITNNKPVVASVGFSSNWQIFYYVWEDSIDGRINLVGRKELLPLGAVEPEAVINGFYLYQNYPNPFNPSTKIKFYLAKNGFVKIIVYNILGERVTTLLNDYLFSGEHEIEFNRKSLHQELSSGVYFYQLKSEKYTSVKKMILLK